jgi:hypothetical protein
MHAEGAGNSLTISTGPTAPYNSIVRQTDFALTKKKKTMHRDLTETMHRDLTETMHREWTETMHRE